MPILNPHRFAPKGAGQRLSVVFRSRMPFFVGLVCSLSVVYLFIIPRKEGPKAPSSDMATLNFEAFDARYTLTGLSLIL